MFQPDTRGHRSYCEAFTRRRNLAPDVLSRENLLTDRGEYLNFLEVQLERVSAACLAAQDFGARIDACAAQASAAEEKVLSATSLIRLAQTYSEEQGREQARINDVLEQRLETLERQVEAASIVSEAASRSPVNVDGDGRGGLRSPNTVSPPWSELPRINKAGLSEWMTGVDKQLEDLRDQVVIYAPASEDVGVVGGSGPVVGEGSSAEDEAEEQQEAEMAEGVAAAAAEEKAEKANDVAAAQQQQPPPPPPAQPAADDELARMEERVRRLEASLAGTASGEARCSSTTPPKQAADCGRGRQLERCAQLARDDLSRSSSSLRPPAAMAVATDKGATDNVVLEAVEEGSAVARKASEMAEEALKVGKEAVERSERTESLAKTLAAKSFKFAKEQHGEVTEALGRLDKKLQEKTGHGSQQRPAKDTLEDGTASIRVAGASNTFETAATGCRDHRCAANVVPEEGGLPNGSGRASVGGSGARPTGRVGGRSRQTRRGAEASEVTSTRVNRERCPGTQDVRDQEQTYRLSLGQIRSVLEGLPADSDNGRRIALGAARTALESILREASAGPLNDGEGGGNEANSGKAAMDSAGVGGHDPRKVDELRGAIRGAVDILSGISSLHLAGECQSKYFRCSRRGSRRGLRLSRSRGRATSPPRRGDRETHVGGYWVPPGTIPCKVGERKGGVATVRAPWDPRSECRETEDTLG